jgi:hypothetical protein
MTGCTKIEEKTLELWPLEVGGRKGGILIGSDVGPPLRFDIMQASLFVGD